MPGPAGQRSCGSGRLAAWCHVVLAQIVARLGDSIPGPEAPVEMKLPSETREVTMTVDPGPDRMNSPV